MDCPVCLKNNTEFWFIKYGYPILHCKYCDHLFTDYEPTLQEVDHIYSDDYFLKVAKDTMIILVKDMLIKRGEYYAYKISEYISLDKDLGQASVASFNLKDYIIKN